MWELSKLLMSDRPLQMIVALRGSTEITFKEFRSDVARLVTQIKPKTRFALTCDDSYLFIVGFYSALHADANLVLLPNHQAATLENFAQEFDQVLDNETVSEMLCSSPTPILSVLTPFELEKPALTFFTSGSTGVPSRIIKTFGMLQREIYAIDDMQKRIMDNTHKISAVYATVPHHHIYGLTFKILWPLATATPFIAVMHTSWEALYEDLRANAMVISSPAHLGRLGGLAPLPAAFRPVGIISAGAPLSFHDSMNAKAILGVRPIEIFGSTETGAIAFRTQTGEDETWQPLPNVEVRADGNMLSVRSPYVGKAGGGIWYSTADRIQIKGLGFLFHGRADRIAKIEAKRVSLTAVEKALCASPLVSRAAVDVLLRPADEQNEVQKEILVAVVVPTPEGREILNRAGSFYFSRQLRTTLALTQEPAGVPRLWRFVDGLPIGTMGKQRSADILRLFGADR